MNIFKKLWLFICIMLYTQHANTISLRDLVTTGKLSFKELGRTGDLRKKINLPVQDFVVINETDEHVQIKLVYQHPINKNINPEAPIGIDENDWKAFLSTKDYKHYMKLHQKNNPFGIKDTPPNDYAGGTILHGAYFDRIEITPVGGSWSDKTKKQLEKAKDKVGGLTIAGFSIETVNNDLRAQKTSITPTTPDQFVFKQNGALLNDTRGNQYFILKNKQNNQTKQKEFYLLPTTERVFKQFLRQKTRERVKRSEQNDAFQNLFIINNAGIKVKMRLFYNTELKNNQPKSLQENWKKFEKNKLKNGINLMLANQKNTAKEIPSPDFAGTTIEKGALFSKLVITPLPADWKEKANRVYSSYDKVTFAPDDYTSTLFNQNGSLKTPPSMEEQHQPDNLYFELYVEGIVPQLKIRPITEQEYTLFLRNLIKQRFLKNEPEGFKKFTYDMQQPQPSPKKRIQKNDSLRSSSDDETITTTQEETDWLDIDTYLSMIGFGKKAAVTSSASTSNNKNSHSPDNYEEKVILSPRTSSEEEDPTPENQQNSIWQNWWQSISSPRNQEPETVMPQEDV